MARDSLSKAEIQAHVAQLQQADRLHRGAQMMHHALRKGTEIDPETAHLSRADRRKLASAKKKLKKQGKL